jgi:RNA polymerase sigma-70 factor (ECF subfamily)
MDRGLAASEERLLKRARAGSTEAFSELVHLHSSKVYGVSLKILKNREDAEDNSQNVFCKAYRSIRHFQGNSKISTWLYRIAVNEALMRLRKRQSERVIGLSEVPGADDQEGVIFEMEDVSPGPERQCIASDLTEKAFRGLDPRMGSTFVLNKSEGWTNRELARAFGTTAETVKSRIFRTRLKLRQEMRALTQPVSVALQA